MPDMFVRLYDLPSPRAERNRLAAPYERGYGYAIVGGVGPAQFHEKACGASFAIPGSDPGIYRSHARVQAR